MIKKYFKLLCMFFFFKVSAVFLVFYVLVNLGYFSWSPGSKLCHELMTLIVSWNEDVLNLLQHLYLKY